MQIEEYRTRPAKCFLVLNRELHPHYSSRTGSLEIADFHSQHSDLFSFEIIGKIRSELSRATDGYASCWENRQMLSAFLRIPVPPATAGNGGKRREGH